MNKIAALATAFGIFSGTAVADPFTGNELQGLCTYGRPDCGSFILGITQGIILGQVYSSRDTTTAFPVKLPKRSLNKSCKNICGNIREQVHRPAGNQVTEALYALFRVQSQIRTLPSADLGSESDWEIVNHQLELGLPHDYSVP